STTRLSRARTTHSLSGLLAMAGLICVTASFGLPLRALAELGLQRSDATDLVAAIEQAPGLVLSQHDSLAVVRAGKTPVLADPLGVALLAASGRWDPTPLAEMIGSEQFSLIVLDAPAAMAVWYDGVAWWPPGIREQIAQHYRFIGCLGEHY